VLLPDGTLQDYKMCSVWEMIFGFKKEKENQLNVLAELCVLNGYPVKKVQIVAIFRDWQMSKAILDKQYPQTQVAVVDFPLWDLNKRVAYIESRLAVHFNGKAECTDEERWLQKRECAVVKVGNKRATKLHATPESAKAHVEMLRKDKPKDRYLIDERPPVYKRCESYCGASGFCPQWKETQEYLKNHAENGFQRPHVVPPFQK